MPVMAGTKMRQKPNPNNVNKMYKYKPLKLDSLPVNNPAVMNNVVMFGANPLMMMLVAEIIEPAIAITRQPNLLTRIAAKGPTK